MSGEEGDTWGGYLDRNMESIKEALYAFERRGCPVTLYQAALFRELALMRSSLVEYGEGDKEDRDEGEAWKRG